MIERALPWFVTAAVALFGAYACNISYKLGVWDGVHNRWQPRVKKALARYESKYTGHDD